MTGKEAKEKLKKQYDRSNDFIRNNYDRISVTVPKGIKEKIKEYLPEKQTVNGLINDLINGWLNDQEQPGATQRHTAPQTVTQFAEDPEEPPHLDTLPEELPPLDGLPDWPFK